MRKFPIKNTLRPKAIILGTVIFGLVCTKLSAQTGTPTENYVKTTTYKKPFPDSQQNPAPDEAAVEIIYFDGLGRPIQKIVHQQSGDGGDLITHIEYDGFGRQANDFLPYERESASLIYETDPIAPLTVFYAQPQYGNTSHFFSQKEFEESSLNRILKQAAPGEEWYMGTDHEIKFAYETNNSNEVHHFSVSLSGSAPELIYDQRYPEGHLYKTVTKDENWESADGDKGTVVEYKDKMGRTILKRGYEVPIDGFKTDPPMALDTYYVYDEYGNLTFVLPPKLSAQIPTSGLISPTLMDALAYQYLYDHRNRVIEKKIPGKDREFMVYDDLDRMVATGPALSPFGDQTEGWLHTKYDIHNRVAYTLWKQGAVGRTERELLAPQTPISESRLTGGSTSNVNGVSFSYTNNVVPTSGYHVLTVNYYDDYIYLGAPISIPTTVGENDIYVHYNSTTKPKGLPTGSWVRQLETAGQTNGIKSYSLYDKKALPVRVNSTNSANGYTQTDTQFDFIGNPQYTKTQHKKDASGYLLTTKDVFTYTPQSRPLKHIHKINSGTEQLLSLNTYDDLGRLIIKKVGGTDQTGAAALQKVDYKYNVRGWMTDINNVTTLADGSAPLDLFAFKILYTHVADDINGAVEPLYNGNIAETYWRTSSDNMVRKYGYTYDHQNRLLDAYYQRPGTTVPRSDSYSAHYSYDRNGNILTLNRNGEQDVANSAIPIDDLQYNYDDGNRLKSVRDYEVSPAGYNDNHTNAGQDDFNYDDYGNLIEDKDKGITAVEYNHLNLPTKITFATGGKIEYFYDATGVKLKKKVTDGTTITTTEYMDGFQYTNSVLDFFPHTEGYIKAVPTGIAGPGGPTGFSFKYVFNYTDHLGNIRLKYAQDPSNGNQISILEEDHYYPYGLKHKGYSSSHLVFTKDEAPEPGIVLTPVNPFLGDSYKYKFGGKEYQTEFDINSYDFGARNYDPALGRWMNIDPLAETSRKFSPYAYALDNPIYFIDPDGMEAGGFANINAETSTASMDVIGGYDVNTVDKDGNVLDTQYHANVNDAGNAASSIKATIDSASNGPSLTNQRNVGGVPGLSMGADGVQKTDGDKFRLRHIFSPDAIYIAGTVDMGAILGAGFEYGAIAILVGPDMGIYPAQDFGIGFSTPTVSAAIEVVKLYYSGDANSVNKLTFYGNRTEYNFGADALGHIGLTATYAKLPDGNTVTGIGASLGIGLSAFIINVNVNTGRTQKEAANMIKNYIKEFE